MNSIKNSAPAAIPADTAAQAESLPAVQRTNRDVSQ